MDSPLENEVGDGRRRRRPAALTIVLIVGICLSSLCLYAAGDRLNPLAAAAALSHLYLLALVAAVLRGKNNPSFTPHLDTGDFVVVVNAEKIRVSGNKPSQKLYRRHSGRPGGMKTETFEALQDRIPERIVEKAIKGMLPHNALGRQMFRKLKVYKGSEHPHSAQKPQPLQLTSSATAK